MQTLEKCLEQSQALRFRKEKACCDSTGVVQEFCSHKQEDSMSLVQPVLYIVSSGPPEAE